MNFLKDIIDTSEYSRTGEISKLIYFERLLRSLDKETLRKIERDLFREIERSHIKDEELEQMLTDIIVHAYKGLPKYL